MIITRAMLLDAVEASLKSGVEHLADVFTAGAEDGEDIAILRERFAKGLREQITVHEAIAQEVEAAFNETT